MLLAAEKIVMNSENSDCPEHFNLARYCLAQGADKHPDKTALFVISDPNAPLEAAEHWSYGQLDHVVRVMAGRLLAHGFKRGERVLISLPNDSVYVFLFFGAIAAGLVPLPVSTMLTEPEVDFLLNDSGAHLIDAGFLSRLEMADPIKDYADTLASDPAFLLYTSGTSGKPKGVLHAQRSAWGRRPMYRGWYGIHSDDIMLHAGAFNWSYTLGAGLVDPWANGATAILYKGDKRPEIWPQLIARTRATLFAAVPSLYRQILKYGELDRHDISALRHGLTAGEALSSAILENWQQITGKQLYEALGMTECSTYISSGPEVAIRPGSPGKPQLGRRIAILPVEEGEIPLPTGETGLLAIHRSDAGLMLGYVNRPEEDAQVFRGEWFIGGDLAVIDSDGYVWYQGRADDVMNAMGYRVSPQEVEAVLSQHPAIAEVAVTEVHPRPDVSVIAAFIVVSDQAVLEAEQIRMWLQERLAAYKQPREFVQVKSLPRTANGKIVRHALSLEMAIHT